MKKCWVFDCGNTAVKWACFDGDRVLDSATGHEDVAVGLAAAGSPDQVLVAASGAIPDWLSSRFAGWDDVRVLRPGQATGVRTTYETPETLGLDRLANAAGAGRLVPTGAAVVVDLGTCVTVDVVENGTFLGGSIAPGYRMRLRAMADFTEALPRLAMPEKSPAVGDLGQSTSSSMWVGAVAGLNAEVGARIMEFDKVWPGLSVIVTGGDASYLQLPAQYRIFADPLLTLKGFRAILQNIADN